MLAEVKKCVENHDIKGLRYIFVDCLDVDPTFEKYRADYEYCKSIGGMFDNYQELTGLTADERNWTTQYWEQLKLDLMKNFSEKRFEHMVKVAKVVYADKIARLLCERSLSQKAAAPQAVSQVPVRQISSDGISKPVSDAELQEKMLAEKKRKLEEENRRIEAQQRAQKERIDAARDAEMNKYNTQKEEPVIKKVMGIVAAVARVVLVVFVVLVVMLIIKLVIMPTIMLIIMALP